MEKQSAKIYGALQATLVKLRELNAAVEANQPIRRDWRLSDAENKENYRRSARLDELSIAIGNAELEAKRLRKAYSDAMADEQNPPSAAPAKSMAEIPQLRKTIAEAEAILAGSQERKRLHVVAASRGDRKAIDALEKIEAAETKARSAIALSSAAIAEIETQNLETQREFAERDADEKHRAGLAAAEALVAWAEKFDNLLSYVAAHYAKLPELQRTLAKSGADINTDLTNRIYTAASRDRAAKASHLHRIFSIDGTVDAVRLGEAFRSLMRAAVRRPHVKKEKAA